MNRIDLKLIKNGTEEEFVLKSCIVESILITSKDINTLVEEGDFLHHSLPDGIVEKYLVDEVISNTNEPPHYEIYVSKLN
ncbi:hypothetical protein [Acinetobacter sp. ANC 4178]|uniref:hypothetical protein n=1 Tax=Acinetobacter sp. ANC 4178 TaxID=2529839 RepID=UPI00103D04C6|nr:hypothetical protein [Acinetobacter sp. ANC 4178]TCB68657.1 hypothetical protein E0H87_01575 [Acinetobacter sp. ANC 4178]